MRRLGASPSILASSIIALRRSIEAFCASSSGCSAADRVLPYLRLQFGEGLLAQVAGLAPAVRELVQRAVEALPVAALRFGMRRGPGLHFLDEREA